MSYQNGEDHQIGKSESTESVNTSTKSFTFSYAQIEYENVQQRVENISDNHSNLQIKNYLCCLADDKLVKVTEIMMQRECIRIKDFYNIKQMPMKKIDEEESIPKFYTKRFNYNGMENMSKKDTKNLIKNIVNLFLKWLKVTKPQGFQALLQKTKSIHKKIKYYNKILMSTLSASRLICQAFLNFSTSDAQQMIQQSRIIDKQCHIKALKFYSKHFKQTFQNQTQTQSH